MDFITKIIDEIFNLIKNILVSFGLSTDRVDEIINGMKEEK